MAEKESQEAMTTGGVKFELSADVDRLVAALVNGILSANQARALAGVEERPAVAVCEYCGERLSSITRRCYKCGAPNPSKEVSSAEKRQSENGDLLQPLAFSEGLLKHLGKRE